jgi:hypothetical protein
MKQRPIRFAVQRAFFAALAIAFPAWAQQSGPLPQAAANSGAAAQTPGSGNPSPMPVAASQSGASTSPATNSPTKTPQIEVPTGTHIPLVLHSGISTRSAKPGDPVYFETLFPVMVDGKVAIPAGSYVSGEVTESKRPGRVKGRGELMIMVVSLILPNAYMVNLKASPSGAGTGGGETVNSEGKVMGDTDKASDAGTVLKTTAAGAGIGGIAARSGEGAAIGAGIGAVAGLGAVLLSRGPEAQLPRGSTVEAVILLCVEKYRPVEIC